MSVGLRRNLLCFVTGALIALAAVLVIREGSDGTPEAGATGAPARVGTETTAAPAVARSVRLRTKHVSPGHGRSRAAQGSDGGGGGAARAGDATGASSGGTTADGAASSATTKPRAHPSRTTPDDPTDPTAADPSSDTGGSGGGDGGDGGQATDPSSPTSPAGDGSSGVDDTSGATGSSGVTIPNPATPDASVGSGG